MELIVFCEFERKRMPVGKLIREKDGYCFTYEKTWLYYDHQLPIGPDLPLQARPYRSKALFQSFVSRIPPRTSENYVRYCEERGISPTEKDEMILLGTIGHKGPSSFVFELDRSRKRQDYVLGVLTRLVDEFSYDTIAAAFGVTKTGLYKLLSKKVAPENSSIYAILEICVFNIDSANWKISTCLLLPDLIKWRVFHAIKKELQQYPSKIR